MKKLLELKDKYNISNEDFAEVLNEFHNANARSLVIDGAILHEASRRDIRYCEISNTSLPYNFDKVQMFAWLFINQHGEI